MTAAAHLSSRLIKCFAGLEVLKRLHLPRTAFSLCLPQVLGLDHQPGQGLTNWLLGRVAEPAWPHRLKSQVWAAEDLVCRNWESPKVKTGLVGMCPGQARHPGHRRDSLQVWLTSTPSVYLEEASFSRPRSKRPQTHFSPPLIFPLFPFPYTSTSSLTPGGRELFIHIYFILFVLFICCPIRFVFFSLSLHKPHLLFHSF